MAVTDLADGGTWVGAMQYSPESQNQIRSNGLWVSKINTLTGIPSPPTWAAINIIETPPPLPACPATYPTVDKPVMIVGPRPEVTGRALYIAYVERQNCKEAAGGSSPLLDGLLNVCRSTDDASTWNGVQFTGIKAARDSLGDPIPGTQPLSPAAAVLDNGRLVVAYNLATFRSDTFVIWSDLEGAAGTWQPTLGSSVAPVPVFTASGAGVPQLISQTRVFPSMARSPLARVGGNNLLYIAYHRYVSAASPLQIGVYLTRSSDGGAAWPIHVPVPVQTPLPGGALANQDNASITIDSLGGINVLWRESDPLSAAPDIRYRLYYARYHRLEPTSQPHFVAELYSYTSAEYGGNIGDYQWITAVDQKVYVAYPGAITNPGPSGQIHVAVRQINLELE